MSGQLAPQPIFMAFGPNGQFLAGGLLYTYAAGTSTPIPVYQDAALTIPWTNPVILNSYGQAVIYVAGGQAYKFNLTDSQGNQIPGWPVDNINSPFSLPSINSGLIPAVTNSFNVGSAAFTWANGYFGTAVYVNGVPVPSYPQTALEAVAIVTPTALQYPPGDIRRYGAIANAAINGSSGADNTAAINTAMSIVGQPALAPPGNWGFKNLLIPAGGALVGQGIHSTNFVSLTGSVGTMFTDTGSAAKVNVTGVAFYGNNCLYTAGFNLGNNGTAFGTEGYLDQIWVRDLPTAFPGIDINGNVAEGGFLISQSTGGLRILGTGLQFLQLECVNPSSFTNSQSVVSCTEFGDGWIGALEIEAPQNNAVLYYCTGNMAIESLVLSLTGGYVNDHLIEIGASATTWFIGNIRYYFALGTAWNSGTVYVIGNLATLAGITYYCTLGNTNQTPPNGTYWRLSPNITGGGNIKSGTQYFGGNASGNNYGGQGNYSSDLMLSSGTFGVKLQQIQCFKVRVTNTGGTIQHCIGTPGDATIAGNFVGQITGAINTLTNTPTGTDASTPFAAGAKIGSASSSVLWLNSLNPMVAADGIYYANITFNNSGTAYTVVPFVSSININGTTQARFALQLFNATSGAAVGWATALGTPTNIIDTGVIGFLR